MNTEIQNPKKSNAWPLILGLVLLGLFVAWMFLKDSLYKQLQTYTEPKIVIIDTQLLIKSASEQVLKTPGISPEAAIQRGGQVAKSLNETVRRYSDAGYIVLVKQAVLGAPVGWDITPDVAKSLNIEIPNRN